MIAYLDTSALARLYLPEVGRGSVVELVGREGVTPCSHLIAYAEMAAALTKAERMQRISAADHHVVWTKFQSDWLAMTRISVDEVLLQRAAALARRFGLRAYDSVHLAVAERVCVTVGAANLVFACFNAKLNTGAGELGMALLDMQRPA
ncbi:MAG TPA: type II toxin-antitoxin system VapC family toxin [Rhodanobacter sp.]